jgi:aminoglycoside 6-adenylyltransferase
MRAEEEMLDIILSFAEKEDRIRVVGMEGSRTNSDIPKDIFQDYDITYVVSEMEPFTKNEDWLDVFGKRIFMQKPEDMALFHPQLGNWFSYLMLFEDGIRIDLTIVPLEELDLYLSSDSLLKVLLDKDDLVGDFPEPSNILYYVERPPLQKFDDCCNEFWWVATYVVKGLCRQEFIYAADYLNQIMRQELLRMLSWKVGIENDFAVSMGKNYKFLEQYVSKELWTRIVATYDMASYDKMWEVLGCLQTLFREISKEVAEELRFPYPNYDENITQYIEEMYEKHEVPNK